MAKADIDILVVGAGPAGLATAIELGTRGVRAMVVESNDRGGVAPRAKTTNIRTRTHLRRWGVADRLAAEAPFGVDYPNNMVFVTRLTGHELARFPNAFNASPERSPLYPEHAQWIPQYALEKVLLEKAQQLDLVEVRLGVTFVAATQDDGHVAAKLRTSDGADEVVASRYLVGADGARSVVRDLIGAKLVGESGLSRSYNIIFRAPGLAAAHGFGPAAIYWQLGKNGFSSIGPMDRDDVWFFMPAIRPDQTLTHEEAADLIRERTGIDLPYEILSADAWVAHQLLADRYSAGRMFLAGDACHLHPPFGGYGMNMGLGDGVDLGWKIAATLQGWGGPELLASYEAERRPVHRQIIEEAVANHAVLRLNIPRDIEEDSAEGEAARGAVSAALQTSKRREFYTLGAVLGLGYEGSPVVCAEPGPAPEFNSERYTPTARPGYLAPHAWLSDGRSLYDAFGDGFTLLAAADADAGEVEAIVEAAAEHGAPVIVLRPDGVSVRDLYGAGLALVRPDQHVAWRGDRWPGGAWSRITGWGC